MWRNKWAQRLWSSRQQVAARSSDWRLRFFSFLGVMTIVSISNARSAIAQIPTIPPTTPTMLPPAFFPPNQTPAVSVPPLQPLSTQAPIPVQTPQPLVRPAESTSAEFSTSPVIEFGQPLPRTTPDSVPIPQSALPRR